MKMEGKTYRIILWGAGKCYRQNKKLIGYLEREGEFEIVAVAETLSRTSSW